MAEAWISGWKESLKPLWLALGAHWSLQKSWKPTEYFLGPSGRNRRRQVQFGFVGSQTADPRPRKDILLTGVRQRSITGVSLWQSQITHQTLTDSANAKQPLRTNSINRVEYRVERRGRSHRLLEEESNLGKWHPRVSPGVRW